ncbi:MAG: acetyl-CoA C-acetyltransferase [Deltaproteobacteria bacterium]|nr:acetyl-CoA C-acetyltransferase [Deltaproteobacteria bacterium]
MGINKKGNIDPSGYSPLDDRGRKQNVVILGGARTPFGAFGKAFLKVSATELGVAAAKGALLKSGIGVSSINSVIFGNVAQTSRDAAYLARHIGLKVGVPQSIAGLTVNRLCGSGFQAVVNAAHEILLGEADCVLAGGTENMSQSPYVLRNVRFGNKMGHSELEDSLWGALTDSHINQAMAVTAESLAQELNISRQHCDEYALLSQKRVEEAYQKNLFNDELWPVKTEYLNVEKDEHPRFGTSLENLSKLPSLFKKNGVVTAGNSSGICDGAAALVVATEAMAQKHSLAPLGRLVSWGVWGCEPQRMGLGPVGAIRIALERAHLKLSDMDLVEINEAFAAQYVAVEKELKLDREITNVNGGAIALGHPLGASGARILLTLLKELRRRGLKFGVGSACIGGGMGIAVIVEAL